MVIRAVQVRVGMSWERSGGAVDWHVWNKVTWSNAPRSVAGIEVVFDGWRRLAAIEILSSFTCLPPDTAVSFLIYAMLRHGLISIGPSSLGFAGPWTTFIHHG